MKPKSTPIVEYAKPKSPPRPAPPRQRITEEHGPEPAPEPAAKKQVHREQPRQRPPHLRPLKVPLPRGADGQPLGYHTLLLGDGWVAARPRRKLGELADKFAIRFYVVFMPDTRMWRHWFAVPDLGTPLDPDLETRLVEAIIAKGLYLPGRLLPGQKPREDVA